MVPTPIVIPNKSIFSTNVTIKTIPDWFEETALVEILSAARRKWLNDNGMRENHIDEGIGMIIKDLHTQLITTAPVSSSLKVSITLGKLFSKGCEVFYQVTNPATAQLLVNAKTSIVFLSLNDFKTVPIPKKFSCLAVQLKPMPEFGLGTQRKMQVKVAMQQAPMFSTQYTVDGTQIEDGVLKHTALIGMLKDTREQLLQKSGIDHNLTARTDDLYVEFLYPAELGDKLTVDISLNSMPDNTCKLTYAVKSLGINKVKVIAKATTDVAFLSANSAKQLPIFESLKALAKVTHTMSALGMSKL